MTNLDIIRAWKDEEYRVSLSDEQRALLPEHPAGAIELPAAQLVEIPFPNSTADGTNCVAPPF